MKIGIAGLILLLLIPAVPAGVASGCDNPYVPAREGLSWTYSVKVKTGEQSQWTLSVSKVSPGGFEWRYAFPQVSFTESFTCSAGGIAAPGFGMEQVAAAMGGTYKITSSSGVVYAAPDKWRVGSSWTASSEGSVSGGGQKFPFKISLTVKVVARERVSVPAGGFDALKLVLTQKGELGAGGAAQPLNYTITQWYASGVGLVRQEDASSVHVLASYKR